MAEEGIRCFPLSLSAFFIPLRQNLSINLELKFFWLGWQPASSSDPPVFSHSARVTGDARPYLPCYISAGIRVHVLLIVQQVLLTIKPSLQPPSFHFYFSGPTLFSLSPNISDAIVTHVVLAFDSKGTLWKEPSSLRYMLWTSNLHLCDIFESWALKYCAVQSVTAIQGTVECPPQKVTSGLLTSAF